MASHNGCIAAYAYKGHTTAPDAFKLLLSASCCCLALGLSMHGSHGSCSSNTNATEGSRGLPAAHPMLEHLPLHTALLCTALPHTLELASGQAFTGPVHVAADCYQ
jgi:hypothetical protein